MKRWLRISEVIDKLNTSIGIFFSWATLLLIVVVCADVIRRLFFDQTAAWIFELEWHLFALIFMFGASFTFLKDQHVRVDVFYSNFIKKDKAWVNIFGILFLLLPWCFIIVYWSLQYAIESYQFNEGSPNPNGIPIWWPIKFVIPLSFALLSLQGLSELIKNMAAIRQPKMN